MYHVQPHAQLAALAAALALAIAIAVAIAQKQKQKQKQKQFANQCQAKPSRGDATPSAALLLIPTADSDSTALPFVSTGQ